MVLQLDIGDREFVIAHDVATLLFGADYNDRKYARNWYMFNSYDPECFDVILRQARARLLLKTSPCIIPSHLEHGVRAMAWRMNVCDKLGIKPPITSRPLLDISEKSNILSPPNSQPCIVTTNAVIDGECSWTISNASIKTMAVGVVPMGFSDFDSVFSTKQSNMSTNDGWWVFYNYDDFDWNDCCFKSEHLGHVVKRYKEEYCGAKSTRTTLTLTASGTLTAKVENISTEITVAHGIPFPVTPAIFFGYASDPVSVEWV